MIEWRRSWLALWLSAFAMLIAAEVAVPQAHTYPSRPIRLIVPFAAGGLNDVVARLVAPYLEKSLGQPVIVDNRPAASGIVGTDATAKATPDGHTLLMVASSFTVIPATHREAALRSAARPRTHRHGGEEFAAVSGQPESAGQIAGGIRRAGQSQSRQVQLRLARRGDRRRIWWSSCSASGPASSCSTSPIAAARRPCWRWSPATRSSPRSRRCCRCRRSRPAHCARSRPASLTREPQFPDLPTVAEQGFPAFEAIQWIGLLTTAGTPERDHRAPQCRDQPRAARPRPDRQIRAAGHLAGRRFARGLSAHDRDRSEELDRNRARRQHQGGVSPSYSGCERHDLKRARGRQF